MEITTNGRDPRRNGRNDNGLSKVILIEIKLTHDNSRMAHDTLLDKYLVRMRMLAEKKVWIG